MQLIITNYLIVFQMVALHRQTSASPILVMKQQLERRIKFKTCINETNFSRGSVRIRFFDPLRHLLIVKICCKRVCMGDCKVRHRVGRILSNMSISFMGKKKKKNLTNRLAVPPSK